MENPAGRLSPIVSRLFELSADEALDARAREAALGLARRTRAQLVALVERRFPAPSPYYFEVLEELASGGVMLESTRTDSGLVAGALRRVENLAAAIEKLLGT
jgi:hypothetical protein